jgi:cytosine deaminase
VTASHCVSLAVQQPAMQQRVSEQVAAAGIAVIALPQTNLFLQGREQPVATPRGLTAVRPLRTAGVTVAAVATTCVTRSIPWAAGMRSRFPR